MSLKLSMGFSFTVIGDGSDANVMSNFGTGPFCLASGGGQVAPAFALSQAMPTGAINLSASNGAAVSATLGLLGAVTFAFNPTPSNNEVVNVSGQLVF